MLNIQFFLFLVIGKARLHSDERRKKVVKPYFHMNNELHFSRAQASLYWRKTEGALNVNLFSRLDQKQF